MYAKGAHTCGNTWQGSPTACMSPCSGAVMRDANKHGHLFTTLVRALGNYWRSIAPVYEVILCIFLLHVLISLGNFV